MGGPPSTNLAVYNGSPGPILIELTRGKQVLGHPLRGLPDTKVVLGKSNPELVGCSVRLYDVTRSRLIEEVKLPSKNLMGGFGIYIIYKDDKVEVR